MAARRPGRAHPLTPRPPLKRTYTIPEAAALLAVTERTVRRLLVAGLLRSRPGAQGRRVLAADIWALLRWGSPRASARARAREDRTGSPHGGPPTP